ncbi:Pheophorbide a oxygenase, chloroplastic [Frankliniella fusca]|uniref:Pheophorbide a oxygenase, chloroplastic n=1 Tax=Frankliniella fusca TaxID=407009 RepID=A0AAE1HUE4_9NEOP|nr:Pheophorbide a oxygenase, chloroplastic [Frankliniella fusca]
MVLYITLRIYKTSEYSSINSFEIVVKIGSGGRSRSLTAIPDLRKMGGLGDGKWTIGFQWKEGFSTGAPLVERRNISCDTFFQPSQPRTIWIVLIEYAFDHWDCQQQGSLRSLSTISMDPDNKIYNNVLGPEGGDEADMLRLLLLLASKGLLLLFTF